VSVAEMVWYLPTRARIADVVRESDDTRTFVLELPGDAAWPAPAPGQFVMLSLPGHGEAAFTVAGWSGDGGSQRLSLTVRRVGSLTGALFDVALGRTVGVRGPYGRGFPAWRADAVSSAGVGCRVSSSSTAWSTARAPGPAAAARSPMRWTPPFLPAGPTSSRPAAHPPCWRRSRVACARHASRHGASRSRSSGR